MQETQVRSLDLHDPLEKGMATQCSILAWKIPRTRERGRWQSRGSQRVGHGLGTKLQPPQFLSRKAVNRTQTLPQSTYSFYHTTLGRFGAWENLHLRLLILVPWREDHPQQMCTRLDTWRLVIFSGFSHQALSPSPCSELQRSFPNDLSGS